ncbi:MAG: nodulation protein NfeD, partial [Candidatus Omnitrophica bacterium]|nr:nodulation protein NfeD [Candidatus Omnitrophota bacterium]
MIQLNDDTVNPVTAEYIVESIDRAHQENVQCLIIKMDTPGGLLNSTRMIVKKMLTSKVPVVVYIAPSGSRAGSAGVFITYASHIAAMAPSTNIGAAHPVQMGGSAPRRSGEWSELKKLIEDLREAKRITQDNEEEGKLLAEESTQEKEELKADENPMESKILQDTVAFIKAIAKQRGRNVEWAVDSVVKSSSITSQEAMEKGVVEILADSDGNLLEQLDGRSVTINGEEVVLQTKGAYIEFIEMDPRQKFFNVLA